MIQVHGTQIQFYCTDTFCSQIPCAALYSLPNGLNAAQVAAQRTGFGPNRMHVLLTPLLNLLFDQLVAPFYLFQAFAAVLWYISLLYVFASLLLALSFLSLVVVIVVTRLVCRAFYPLRLPQRLAH